jgi:hypothetical protein
MKPAPDRSGRTAEAAPLEPRTLAILAAAVVSVLGPRARIRRVVRYVRDPSSFWVAQGRLALQPPRGAWKPSS